MNNTCEQSIFLFKNVDRANDALKIASKKGQSFTKKFTTPKNLVLDFYKQISPDAKVVDELTRCAILLSVVESIEDDEICEYFSTTGSISFLCDFVKNTTGLKVLDEIEISNNPKNSSKDDKFSELEIETIKIAKKYRSTLNAFGYVELSECAYKLATLIDAKFQVVLKDVINLSPALFAFLNHISEGNFKFEDASDTKPYSSALKDKDLSVLELSGNEAFPLALTNTLKRTDEDNIKSVLLLTNGVSSTFQKVATINEREGLGFSVCANAKQKVKDTNFGRALIGAFELYCGSLNLTVLTDLMRNPLLGISFYEANSTDVKLRENPIKVEDSIESVFKNLKESSKAFSLIYEIISCDLGRAIEAVREFKKIVEVNVNLSDYDKKIEFDSIECVQAILELLFSIGLVERFSPIFLEMCILPKSFATGDKNADKRIEVRSIAGASNVKKSSFDLVICDDVSTDSFSASTKLDSLKNLLEKLKCKQTLTTIEIKRDNFLSMLDAASKKVVLMMPLRNSATATELYASFPMQEMCLELCSTLDYSKIEASRTPLKSYEFLQFSEDRISQNIGLNPPSSSHLPFRPLNHLTFTLNDKKALRSYLDNIGDERGLLVLSPSAIETYLHCPYKWFYNYVIGARELDREFSPIEDGNVAHLAFKKFYDSLFESGVYRLNSPDDVVSFQEKFSASFNDAAIELYDVDLKNLGAGEMSPEEIEIGLRLNKLSKTCINSLLAQVFIPKDYVVLESEFEFKRDDNINYAGATIAGRVDRIDINRARDSFLVIDYKGNLENHNAGFTIKDASNAISDECVFIPYKTQALIYASCISKKINKKCDGAIYLTYKEVKPPKLPAAGTISVDVADGFSDILDVSKATCQTDMETYLKFVESQIALKIEQLQNGNIEPRPLKPSVCDYCSVRDCPKRGCRI